MAKKSMLYLLMTDAPEARHKFEILYEEYRNLMFYIANRILNNPQDAEDAVHSAFLAIAENLEKISDPVCPKTKGYIVTVVESKAIDIYRRKRRHPSISSEDISPISAMLSEDATAFGRCFSLLSAEERQLLLLKYRYGYQGREIAKLLHITYASTAKRIQRAKEKLERLCKEEGLL